MDIIEQLQQVALNTFRAFLPISPEEDGAFRTTVKVKVGDEIKPLMLIGNIRGIVEDGHCLAVLNPDEEVRDRLVAGVAYSHGILREIVAKRCDLALFFSIDSYKKKKPVTLFTKYQSTKPMPAKFAVR